MKIFDLHSDFPTSTGEYKSGYKSIAASKAQGVKISRLIVIEAFWTTRLKKPLNFIKDYIKREAINKLALYSIEDLWFCKNEKILEEVLALPIVSVGLSWNKKNSICGGAFSESGFSRWGKAVLKKIAGSSIILDTAHLNKKSFSYAIDNIEKVFCSHTALNSFHFHPRNLDKSQVRLILEKGGIIGLTPVSDFIKAEKATVYSFANLLCEYAQHFGTNGLAIGTDFFGTEPLCGLEGYNDFEALAGLLKAKGFSNSNIADIFFGTAKRFFSKNSPFVFNEANEK